MTQNLRLSLVVMAGVNLCDIMLTQVLDCDKSMVTQALLAVPGILQFRQERAREHCFFVWFGATPQKFQSMARETVLKN